MALQTLQGQTLPVVVNDQGTFVDEAQVIAGDYVADNGVVHVLDSVLAPQGLPTQHVMGWIEESEEHGILWLAIQQLGLQGDLSFRCSSTTVTASPDRGRCGRRRIWPLKS